MEQEKVKYLIDLINNMDIKDKLRLAICMSQSKWSGLIYNTKENYDKFDAISKYEKNDKGEYTVSGIDEQIKDVKEKYSFLFEDENDGTGNSDINLGGEHDKGSKNTPTTLLGALQEKYK